MSQVSVDLGTLIQRINEREGTAFRLVGRYSTGEAGAYALADVDGSRAVLKWHPDTARLHALQHGVAVTEMLRSVGYPAPIYRSAGVVVGCTYSIQEELPGTPLGAVTLELLPRLLELNALQIGLAIADAGDASEWPRPVTEPVLVGGDGFCLLEPIRAYSSATAELLRGAQAYVRAYSGGTFATGDIVHMDFNPANILVTEGAISGVVDWEDCHTGDCSFDLATLLFYAYDDAEVREQLQRRILERATPAALAVYLAHLIVRQVDWSIRHHDSATVARYVHVSQRILADLDSLCRLPA